MLLPHKNRFFSRWFTHVIDGRLRRTFAQVTVHGLAHLPVGKPPLLLIANHSSYWDALLIVWLSHHVLGAHAYAWMHAHTLQDMPMFQLLGAFGVDGGAPADIKAALKFSQKLLDRDNHALWIFPQGDEKPLERRPLGFQRGSAFLAARAARAVTLPVALHYAFGRTEKPEVRICIGAPLAAGTATVAHHEAAVTCLLDACCQGAPHLATVCPQSRKFLPEAPAAHGLWHVRCLNRLCRWLVKGVSDDTTH